MSSPHSVTAEESGTVPAGTDTSYLGSWTPQSIGELTTVFAAAFEALADLHRSGVTHGSINERSFLLDRRQFPILGSPTKPSAATPISAEADTNALVSLLAAAGQRLAPDQASLAILVRFSSRGTRRVQRLVADYRRSPRAGRMSAEVIASWLAKMAGNPTSPSVLTMPGPATDTASGEARSASSFQPTRPFRSRPTTVHPKESHRSRPTRILLGLAALLLVVSVLFFVGRNAGDTSTAHSPLPPLDQTSAGPSPHQELAPLAASDTQTHTVQPPRCDGVLVDDHCESVTLGQGFVMVGQRRYAVGTGHEHLAFGDWDCDGISTVAVVRPMTGEVFVFDEWVFESPVEARLVALLSNVSFPRTIELDNGCHDLEVPNGNQLWTLTGADA